MAIIDYCEKLENEKKYILTWQPMKSGIAAKEAGKTEYWLMLCNESQHYPNPQLLLEELQSIIRIISKIISSSKS